jgi:hypothetical protein
MNTQTAYPQAQPPQSMSACAAYHSDSHFIMGLGVVLLCFGQALTGSHTVTIIGLAMIVLSGWLD